MSDFRTVKISDSVIGDITGDIDFGVKSGGSQVTYNKYAATSAANSSLIFSISVPSENVVIGHRFPPSVSIGVSHDDCNVFYK